MASIISSDATVCKTLVNTLIVEQKKEPEKIEVASFAESVCSDATISALALLCKDVPLREYTSKAAKDHFHNFYDLSSKLFAFESAYKNQITEVIQCVVTRVLNEGNACNIVLYEDCVYKFISDMKDVFSEIKEIIKVHTHSIALLCNNENDNSIKIKSASKEAQSRYKSITSILNDINGTEKKIKHITFFANEIMNYASLYNKRYIYQPLNIDRTIVFNFLWHLMVSAQEKESSCCVIM